MARKHQRGEMSHLLIDRFRFDSFAPDSDEAGSNLLTRFGQAVYLFFMITPPELLVERAWARGLEFGRYKAVDDTLAHAVEAYTGIPDVFFTWVRHSDKRIQFEFLDNTVPFGTRPRTVAFGDNNTFNVLNVKGILDIERYGRVDVDAAAPDLLYADRSPLEAEHNTDSAALHRRISRDQFRGPDERANLSSHRMRHSGLGGSNPAASGDFGSRYAQRIERGRAGCIAR
jgi:hypothetical protein